MHHGMKQHIKNEGYVLIYVFRIGHSKKFKRFNKNIVKNAQYASCCSTSNMNCFTDCKQQIEGQCPFIDTVTVYMKRNC